jgi:hypothetical protein
MSLEEFKNILNKSDHFDDRFEPEKFADSQNMDLVDFRGKKEIYCDEYYELLVESLIRPQSYSYYDYNNILELFFELPSKTKYDLARRDGTGFPILHEIANQAYVYPLGLRNFINAWDKLHVYKDIPQKHLLTVFEVLCGNLSDLNEEEMRDIDIYELDLNIVDWIIKQRRKIKSKFDFKDVQEMIENHNRKIRIKENFSLFCSNINF